MPSCRRGSKTRFHEAPSGVDRTTAEPLTVNLRVAGSSPAFGSWKLLGINRLGGERPQVGGTPPFPIQRKSALPGLPLLDRSGVSLAGVRLAWKCFLRRRFLMSRQVSSDSGRAPVYQVTENWFEELKAGRVKDRTRR